MNKLGDYLPNDKMFTLIDDDYRHLQVLSRFGIPLGFGDKTIQEVCADNNVDCFTFLCVVNFIVNNTQNTENIARLSLKSLLHYLKQSHIYFLEFCLPSLRRKLLDGIILKDSDISLLVLKLFDEYVAGVSEHMKEEEKFLFPIVEAEDKNILFEENFTLATSKHHAKVGEKLNELKKIIIKYCPGEANANLLNSVLFDIYRCEEELSSHCSIEDHLLMPALRAHFEENVSEN